MGYELYRARAAVGGSTPQEKLESGRMANFEKFLKASPHTAIFDRVSIANDSQEYPCVLEPHKQNEDKDICHLLCRKGVRLAPGEILLIRTGTNKIPSIPTTSLLPDDIATGILGRYMVWYWDERRDSGYNRYTLVKMTYNVTWRDADESNTTVYSSLGHVYGQQDNMLKNELKSRSRSATLYLENLKADFILMPSNVNMKFNSYISLTIPMNGSNIVRHYHVTGFDSVSSPGVTYVTMDPMYEKDLTPAPQQQQGESDDDFFFLNLAGGVG